MLGMHILGITNTKNQLAWFENTSMKKLFKTNITWTCSKTQTQMKGCELDGH
jgi:hypothetical protein